MECLRKIKMLPLLHRPPRFDLVVSRYTCTSPHPTLTPLSAPGSLGAAFTRIDYKTDPINGDRSLGDVGGEDAFPDSRGGHIKYLGTVIRL